MTKVRSFVGSRPFLWAIGSLLLAGLLSYCNSLSGPFIFDDILSIPENTTIRHLWGWWNVFSQSTASGQTVGARPLLNLTFAIDYFFHRQSVWGYHAGNILIHLLAALTLFGFVRRTLRQPLFEKKYGRDSLVLAWAVALLWEIHPLQTEAVTYMVQRAESLVSLFYLMTLYCFCRGSRTDEPDSNRWLLLSAVSALLGAGVKEVIVSAPVVVLLYDRTFVSGSFGAALRRRKWYYLALACTWIALAGLIVAAGDRGHTVGKVEGVSWDRYALSQFPVLLSYLRLVFWPHPLVLFYSPVWVKHPLEALPAALIILSLMVASVWILRFTVRPDRPWPAIGFLGCSFFLILAPTSSVVPLENGMFEHRMYLALAPVVAGIVLALYAWLGRRAVYIASLVLTPPLMAMTLLRNEDYRTPISIWSNTTVPSRADFYRTRNNYGLDLSDAGRFEEALVQYREVERLKPDDPLVHCNIGVVYDRMGRYADALKEYDLALQRDPAFPQAYANRGVVFAQMGQLDEAIEQYRHSLEIDPHNSESERNLGIVYATKGDLASALEHYRKALAIDPNNVEAHSDLGEALGEQGHFVESLAEYAEVLKLDPANAEAYYNRGVALTALGKISDAIDEYRKALVLNPHYARARSNLNYLESRQR